MSDKELTNFEATIVLRRAMALNKINLEEDPYYEDLQNAKWEKEMTKYGFFTVGVLNNMVLLYSFRWKTKVPWHKVFGRMCSVVALWTFFYWTSPGVRKYNEALIKISKARKKELLDIFQ